MSRGWTSEFNRHVEACPTITIDPRWLLDVCVAGILGFTFQEFRD